MNVLHLVAGELDGGAARGAYWLHKALREIGVDSVILSNAKETYGDETVISLANSPLRRLKFAVSKRLGRAPVRAYPRRHHRIFNTGFDGIDITRHPAYAAADVIHLHWINGLVRIGTLNKVTRPVVWTLRDMWPFTGGCHYAIDCERYTGACGRCPQLRSKHERDLTSHVLRHKQKSMPRGMRVIGISRWLSECAKESTLFRDYEVATISNNVDVRSFTPLPKSEARQALGLQDGKKVVLVGAQDAANFYKGFEFFLEALENLKRDDLQILLFGGSGASVPDSLGIQSTHLGFLPDIDALRRAYSAADVFVAPSRMDAFGKTLVEAMACETPVVCFDATGPRDIVEHGVDGYKAEPFSPTDLARGIRWVLDQSAEAHAAMCKKAREHAEQRFDSRVIARQYETVYHQALAETRCDVSAGTLQGQ